MRGKFVVFRPALEGPFAGRFYRQIRDALGTGVMNSREQFSDLVHTELAWVDNETINPGQKEKYRACWLVLRDLSRSSWHFRWRANTLEIAAPVRESGSIRDPRLQKEVVRDAMSHARGERIRQAADFLERMLSPPKKGLATQPITVLCADGQLLAEDLRRIDLIDDIEAKKVYARQVIKPYLQLVAEKERCIHTGHLLSDIWRYFRFTWTTPPESTPGRSISYLIRDAARPFHPIMGIICLENSPVCITCRDEYLGWSPESFINSLSSLTSTAAIRKSFRGLMDSINYALGEINIKGLCSRRDLEAPSTHLVDQLFEMARQSASDRIKAVKDWLDSSQEQDSDTGLEKSALGNVSTAAVEALYRRKRTERLGRLLSAKIHLIRLLADKTFRTKVNHFVKTEEGIAAIRAAIVARKNCHIGTSILELSVCGAVPPYNHILGGKLAALLSLSPQVVEDYRKRYGQRASDIASKMKGKPVIRPAALVYLGTTSLYESGSSQYNRLKLPRSLFSDKSPEVEWIKIGATEGFGTLHISFETASTLEAVVRAKSAPMANHVFGEGASPKLRTIRAGLESVLQPPFHRSTVEAICQHSMRRLVYGALLATNARQYLSNSASRPKYYFDGIASTAAGTQKIVDYWLDRWLLSRLRYRPAIEQIARFDKDIALVSAPHRRSTVNRLHAGDLQEVGHE